jgi:hypothetical protein
VVADELVDVPSRTVMVLMRLDAAIAGEDVHD